MIQPTEARFYASEILAYTDALNLVYHIHALPHLSLNLWSFGHGHFWSKSFRVLAIPHLLGEIFHTFSTLFPRTFTVQNVNPVGLALSLLFLYNKPTAVNAVKLPKQLYSFIHTYSHKLRNRLYCEIYVDVTVLVYPAVFA